MTDSFAQFTEAMTRRRFGGDMVSAPKKLDGDPEEAARAFGVKLAREHPRDWPRLLGLAVQAAMEQEHGEGG